MDLLRCFTAHPATVGESYGGHLLRASSFGVRMMLAGAACIVHGLLPFLFVRTGSRTISDLNAQLTSRARAADSPAAALRIDLLNS
jgi:hypothetical protein